MKSVVDELITILGLELDPKTTENVKKATGMLDSVTRYANWMGAALIAAASTLAYIAEKTAESAAHTYKMGQLTGISTDKLQAMGFAAIASGGSINSLEGDLMGLTKSMSSPIPGEFNHALFMMGISVHGASGKLKTADELLLNIADKMKGMSAQTQIQWASKLGISDDTLLMLKSGREEIERLQGLARKIPVIVDEKALKSAREFTIQFAIMGKMISALQQSMMSAAGPVMTQMVNDFQDFLRVNKDLIALKLKDFIDGIVLGFEQFSDIIKAIKEKFNDLFPGLDGFIDKMTSSKKIADFVTTAMIALTAALVIANAQWAAIAGVLYVVSLAVGDYIKYLNGADSATGRLIESTKKMYREFETKYPALYKLVDWLWQRLSLLAEITFDTIITGFGKMFRPIELIAKWLDKIVGYIMTLTEKPLKIDIGMSDTANTIGDMLGIGNIINPYGNRSFITGAMNYIENRPRQVFDSSQKETVLNLTLNGETKKFFFGRENGDESLAIYDVAFSR